MKILLGMDLGEIRVIPQKVYWGSDTDRHGTRLDVYIEESGKTGTVFDVEPDKNTTPKLINAVPRRVRFYHSKIDGRSLKSGDDYSQLKRVLVIMITSYDPFGKDRIVYTVKNSCVEEPDMEYDDGAATLFFYTKGKIGDVPEELRKLLHYMEDSSAKNADSETLQEIHRIVQTVRYDKEVSLEFMKAYEHDLMMQELGEIRGEAKGKAIGKAQGKLENKVQVIRKLSKTMEREKLADLLELEPDCVNRIMACLEEFPEKADAEIAIQMLGEAVV